MKKFFAEFKTFIMRGNVLDLAVGVIVGSAFTAIVTALTNNILKPFINWLLFLIFGGNDALSIYTFLVRAEDATGAVDLAKSVYIDWGSLINAIINFLIVAFILFLIVKAINAVSEGNEKLKKEMKRNKLTKSDKKEMREAGLNPKNCADVKKFVEDKEAQAKAQAEEEDRQKKLEEEEAKKHTTEGLLEQIKELLEKQAK